MTGDGSGDGSIDRSGDGSIDRSVDEASGDRPREGSVEPPLDRVRERVLAGHRDVLGTVGDCADAVAADRSAPATDGRALAAALERSLDDAGVLSRFPAVLSTAVDALGGSLRADPVAAPPYVVVTSRGPMCRGTTDRGRLVLLVRTFDVHRTSDVAQNDSRRYERCGDSVRDALDVSLRS